MSQSILIFDPATDPATRDVCEREQQRHADLTEVPEPDPAGDGYYDADRREYLIKNQRGAWLPLTEAQYKRHLHAAGFSSSVPKTAMLSPVDEKLLELQHTRDIHYSGRLCGRPEGFYEENGSRFLVTESPRTIEAVPGDWAVLRALLEGLLCINEPVHGQRQWDILHGWLQTARRALDAGQIQPGQVLAYPRGSA